MADVAQALPNLTQDPKEDQVMPERQVCYLPMPGALLLIAILMVFGVGPAAVNSAVGRTAAIAEQVGIASWYGSRFHGRKTANGDVFNQNRMTAAHRTLPLGTKVEVTNVTNGKSVEVRINDRGPYVNGRVIDLSRAAAVRLGMKDVGLARVRIEVKS